MPSPKEKVEVHLLAQLCKKKYEYPLQGHHLVEDK